MNRETNPFNPFPGSPTAVGYSFGQSLGPITYAGKTQNYIATVGARFKFGAGWQATLSESYGRETLYDNAYNQVNQEVLALELASTSAATAFNAFSTAANPASVAALRREDVLHAVSTIETTSFIADGPLFDLPAGACKMALAWSAGRRVSVTRFPISPVPPSTRRKMPANSRHVGSAFTELSLPLLGSAEKSAFRATSRADTGWTL